MKEQLANKLTQDIPYTKDELTWLLRHIGDPNPSVRDELVYPSFCHAILDQLTSPENLNFLLSYSQAQQLQTIGVGEKDERTLTRSFTSLLHALLVFQDSQKPFLEPETRTQLFESALEYLPSERDTRGYDNTYGWIHAIAHGADFLLAVACHPSFPAEHLERVWESISQTLKNSAHPLSAGEPGRLAHILVQLVLQEKTSSEQVAKWLEQLQIKGDSPTDYTRQLAIQAFLSSLYFQLKAEEALSTDLEISLLAHPHLLLL